MIQALPNSDKYGNRIFNDKTNTIREGFDTVRKRILKLKRTHDLDRYTWDSFRAFLRL